VKIVIGTEILGPHISGVTVATETCVGDRPRECQRSEDYDLTRLEGPDVSYGDIHSAMSTYVTNPTAQ
jgi:hypothetical protein